MRLTYWLTKDAKRAIFVESGREVKDEQSIEVNGAELSKQDRAWLADRGPRLTVPFVSPHTFYGGNGPIGEQQFTFDRLVEAPDDVAALVAAHRTACQAGEAAANAARDAEIARLTTDCEAELARPVDPFHDTERRVPTWLGDRPGVARLRELAQQINARRDAATLARKAETYRQIIANPSHLTTIDPIHRDYWQHPDYAAVEALRQDADTAVRRAKDAHEAAERAERARRDAEKADWIAAHGSDHLKRAVAAGHDSQRRYVTERAAAEYPGYEVDFDDEAGWKSRSFPSEAALDEAEKSGGEVVWLTTRPAAREYDDEDQECEAVVVSNFLGKYDLIKIM